MTINIWNYSFAKVCQDIGIFLVAVFLIFVDIENIINPCTRFVQPVFKDLRKKLNISFHFLSSSRLTASSAAQFHVGFFWLLLHSLYFN
jgi:hypothetical protein